MDSVDAELLGPEEVHVLVELLVDGTDDDTRGCQKKKKKKKEQCKKTCFSPALKKPTDAGIVAGAIDDGGADDNVVEVGDLLDLLLGLLLVLGDGGPGLLLRVLVAGFLHFVFLRPQAAKRRIPCPPRRSERSKAQQRS